MLPVYVVGLSARNVASAALACERVEHETLVCTEPLHYGQHVAALWEGGEGFVLVEDDIAPWPGAVHQLGECGDSWCGFPYVWGEGGVMGGTLGCWKVSGELVREHPDLPHQWTGTDWLHLDRRIMGALAQVTRRTHWHSHFPPVAHAYHLR